MNSLLECINQYIWEYVCIYAWLYTYTVYNPMHLLIVVNIYICSDMRCLDQRVYECITIYMNVIQFMLTLTSMNFSEWKTRIVNYTCNMCCLQFTFKTSCLLLLHCILWWSWSRKLCGCIAILYSVRNVCITRWITSANFKMQFLYI